MKIVGSALSKNIIRKCVCCGESFFMTCEDFVFNKCGEPIRHDETETFYDERSGKTLNIKRSLRSNDWVCNDCIEKLMEIRNL